MDNMYVIAYNDNGEREQVTCCPKNNARFYEELYKGDGYRVEVLTSEEVDTVVDGQE